MPLIELFPLGKITLRAKTLVFHVVLLVDGHLVALEHELAVHLAPVTGGFAPAGADGLPLLNGVGQLQKAGGAGEHRH